MKFLQIFADTTVESIDEGKLVTREKRVAFMNVGTKTAPKYVRMQGFTSMSDGKNASEYSRRYVDEATERSDVTGYAAQVDFEFDRYSPFVVHEKLADIIDNEKLGSETHVEIVVVDLFKGDTTSGFAAKYREYSVIPDSVGDGTDALIYSGTLKAIGSAKDGTAKSSDDWATLTFTEA